MSKGFPGWPSSVPLAYGPLPLDYPEHPDRLDQGRPWFLSNPPIINLKPEELIDTFEINLRCDNCGYKWLGHYPKGTWLNDEESGLHFYRDGVKISVVCPSCQCMNGVRKDFE